MGITISLDCVCEKCGAVERIHCCVYDEYDPNSYHGPYGEIPKGWELLEYNKMLCPKCAKERNNSDV